MSNSKFGEEAKSIVLAMSGNPWGRQEAIQALTALHNRLVEAARIELLEEIQIVSHQDNQMAPGPWIDRRLAAERKAAHAQLTTKEDKTND